MNPSYKYESAEIVRDPSGRQYHLQVAPGEVAPSIILVGDPQRAERVAARFEHVELTRSNREYLTITGTHQGLPVSVVGTGMGAGVTEIAIVELCQCVENPLMIRCGSSGALQTYINLGDIVISQGAYRMENTSTWFVDEGYPAVADPQVVLALLQAADEANVHHHLGITATSPGFYGGQGRNIPGFNVREPEILERLQRQGIKNLEMETSCLLTLASLRGFRAGAACAIFANRTQNVFITNEQKQISEQNCIDICLKALHILARMDQKQGKKTYWHPGLG